MKLVTATQMRELDRAAIEKHRIPSLTLMERAGQGVARAVLSLSPGGDGVVVVFCGRGNNGGDGLVAARLLREAGREIFVIVLADRDELSPDARTNWDRLAPLTARIATPRSAADLAALMPCIAGASLAIDAIFGTGLDRPATGVAAAAIEALNSLNVPVVAVDVPSGLSADSGLPIGLAVKADITVTFGFAKQGLVLGEGRSFAGKIEVVDIGIPPEEGNRIATKLELIEPAMFASRFWKRDPASHKGTFGHVAVFAGSRGHLGAGYLSCLAALRAGAGLATYILPERSFAKFDALYPEIMCDAIPDGGKGVFSPEGLDVALSLLAGKSAAAIGPAIGTDDSTRAFLNAFVAQAKLPLVIDADGLNLIDLSILAARRHATVLTPHPGEMGRLLGMPTELVQRDRIGCAARLAEAHGVTVVLKGHDTIVANPDGASAINPTGNAGMATAGMGDALTGVIAAFLAEGMDAKTASCPAAYVHGRAGDMVAAEHGERALIASDVIGKLGDALTEVGRAD